MAAISRSWMLFPTGPPLVNGCFDKITSFYDSKQTFMTFELEKCLCDLHVCLKEVYGPDLLN